MNTYVINLDAALENHPETDPGNVQELLANIESVPVDIRTAVSGGRYHHRGVCTDRCGDSQEWAPPSTSTSPRPTTPQTILALTAASGLRGNARSEREGTRKE
jgi:hypothetical protein